MVAVEGLYDNGKIILSRFILYFAEKDDCREAERSVNFFEDKKTIRKALCNEQWTDLEDGLQMQCADKEKMDYIVTRNIRDFKMSKVLAIEPEQFIEIYKTQ